MVESSDSDSDIGIIEPRRPLPGQGPVEYQEWNFDRQQWWHPSVWALAEVQYLSTFLDVSVCVWRALDSDDENL